MRFIALLNILTDNVVLEKPEHFVDVDLLNDVPEPFHDILYRLLAHTLIAEALNARSAIGQNVGRFNGEARLVDAHAAAPFAGVQNDVAHAALQALRLAVWYTFAVAALATLEALGAVRHARRLGTLGMVARAAGLLLACGVLRVTALDARQHETTILAAWRILVAAVGVSSQLAVFVAARIIVFRSQQAGVALFVPLDAQVAAKGLLRLGETTARLGLQHLPDGPQRTGRKLLVVHVVAAHRVGVHQVAAALRGARTALGYVGIVFGAPVVTELMGSHEVGLARYHPLSVVIS